MPSKEFVALSVPQDFHLKAFFIPFLLYSFINSYFVILHCFALLFLKFYVFYLFFFLLFCVQISLSSLISPNGHFFYCLLRRLSHTHTHTYTQTHTFCLLNFLSFSFCFCTAHYNILFKDVTYEYISFIFIFPPSIFFISLHILFPCYSAFSLFLTLD